MNVLIHLHRLPPTVTIHHKPQERKSINNEPLCVEAVVISQYAGGPRHGGIVLVGSPLPFSMDLLLAVE